MKAMVLDAITDLKTNRNPLRLAEVPRPKPQSGQVLVKVRRCGVCHTELDEIEGRTPPASFPVILGHQVVGTVVENGDGAHRFKSGERVGIAWIYSACGRCALCRGGFENLCAAFQATGRDADGGYAEYTTVPDQFAYPIPPAFSDSQAAPLLCAGAIGYRSLALTGLQDGQVLGLVGFGASAHLVLQMAKHRYPNSPVFVFARSPNERAFAIELGADWSGDIDDTPPHSLTAAIDTTPVWRPIVRTMEYLLPGGRLVINAIRKEEVDKKELVGIDYPRHLWMEKEIKSVANVARSDVSGFLSLAAEIPILPEVQEFRLEEANKALLELKEQRVRGAKVLVVEP
ncbi:MAG TPA: alcohol dehydrogenase [Deltaproteobacteria bacterium]|nr:alcohol dehydrogenase [Deltaproteobacteria bacterium]